VSRNAGSVVKARRTAALEQPVLTVSPLPGAAVGYVGHDRPGIRAFDRTANSAIAVSATSAPATHCARDLLETASVHSVVVHTSPVIEAILSVDPIFHLAVSDTDASSSRAAWTGGDGRERGSHPHRRRHVCRTRVARQPLTDRRSTVERLEGRSDLQVLSPSPVAARLMRRG
jgi:hypothetical protein